MEKFLKGKKSVIWNFFTPSDETKAKCNFCKQTLSYKSSITNLRTHIQRKHPTIKILGSSNAPTVSSETLSDRNEPSTSHSFPTDNLDNIPNKIDTDVQPSASSSFSRSKAVGKDLQQTTLRVPKKIGFSQKKTFDESLLDLVTKDFQPFSIVEDTGFRKYTYALNPSYTIPSRKTLSSTLLPAKFEEVQIKTRAILKCVKSVTITTDCWTSCNNDSFIAVTAHFIDDNLGAKSVLLEVGSCDVSHTSINLSNEIRRITSEWGLQDKVFIAISDNAANIKKAIAEELEWKHLGCIAHTINLIVKDALVLVDPLISKVSDIVSHFKRSTLAKTKLDFYQRQNDKQPKKLIQSVATRWNSVYYMLDRIKELKEEVRAALAALGKEDWPMLSNLEFQYVEELIEILEPMETTTSVMSSEKQVTLSLVIVITNGLQNLYQEMAKMKYDQFSDTSKTVLEKILSGIDTRFKNLENSSTLLLSSFLDPRFKHIAFSTEKAAEKAKNLGTNALTALIEKMDQETGNFMLTTVTGVHESHQEQQRAGKKLSIWSSFDKKALSFTPSGSKRSRAIIEIQRYMEESLLYRTEDPLEWWRKHAYNYPYLSELVKYKFGTVATSVPCERMFSKSGQLISDRRNRISSNKVKQIMFICQNENG